MNHNLNNEITLVPLVQEFSVGTGAVYSIAASSDVVEGDVGTGNSITFTVMRSGNLSIPENITYMLSGSATLGIDYIVNGTTVTNSGNGATGTISFGDSVSSASFTVTTIPDQTVEPDEIVTATISAPSSGGSISAVNFAASAEILNDDASLGAGSGGSDGGGGVSVSTMPTPRPDLLTGTTSDDVIAALESDDTVSGLAGNDLLLGNQGNDLIDAGDGRDTVYGGQGDDSISAGAGDDAVFGDEGADTIDAGEGNNTVSGGQDSTDGADVITAGSGNDFLLGNGGADTIVGGAGADTLVGGAGNDRLNGDPGNDIILGNLGSDLIFGGAGNDTIFGGQGADTIQGDEGADLLIFGATAGSDVVLNFNPSEGDRLDFQGQTYELRVNSNGDDVAVLSGGGSVTLVGVTERSIFGLTFVS